MSTLHSDADDGEGSWDATALLADGMSTNNKRGRDDLEEIAPMLDSTVDGIDKLGSNT